jgi:hypothetical protein
MTKRENNHEDLVALTPRGSLFVPPGEPPEKAGNGHRREADSDPC